MLLCSCLCEEEAFKSDTEMCHVVQHAVPRPLLSVLYSQRFVFPLPVKAAGHSWLQEQVEAGAKTFFFLILGGHLGSFRLEGNTEP